MAIDTIRAYSHLTDDDIEEIGRRFDAIRASIESDLGSKDVRYIKGLIRSQRFLELAGRICIVSAPNPAVRAVGVSALSLSKVLENLEIAHNVSHGQWDWMNDPEIHSATWEWDNACPSAQWKHSHNHVHHTYTNILGMDNDVGYGVLRVTRDKKWTPMNGFQPLINIVLALLFQWAVAFYDVNLGAYFKGRRTWEETKPEFMDVVRKGGRQILRDYLLWPAIAAVVHPRQRGQAAKKTAQAIMVANLVRNVWAYAVIFCGHFPDETETFTKKQWKNETHAEWYLRQMLGSANFRGGKILTILSGNLNYQIEHHLFPDMPSNRLAQIGREVESIAREFDLPYNTDSFPRQFLLVQRTLLKLTLPNRFLAATGDNAPEVRTNRAFEITGVESLLTVGSHNGIRHGLKEGLQLLSLARPGIKESLRHALRALRRRAPELS